jgi:hypothetical protein
VVSLEEVEEEETGKSSDLPDIDGDDDDDVDLGDDDDDDTFLASEDEDDDDVTGIIGVGGEDDEET